MISFVLSQFYKKRRVVKYLIAGGFSTSVDFLLLFIFTDIFGWWYLASSALAFIVAFAVSFYLQKFWTFRNKAQGQTYNQLFLYFSTAIFNLGINTLLMYIFVDRFGIWYIAAQFMVTGIIAIWSYMIYGHFIFKKKIENAPKPKENFNILIATGIYPPDIGGPATFAQKIAKSFAENDIGIRILTYSNEKDEDNICHIRKDQNIIARYAKYFWKIYRSMEWFDLLYSFDITSVGLPCALIKTIAPEKKLIIRLGGDIQWEASLEKRRHDQDLETYYKEKNFPWPENLKYFLANFVLKKADMIIFNSEMLKDIYVNHRGLDAKKTETIHNFANTAAKKRDAKTLDKNILFAGRLVAFKNIPVLIDAFLLINRKNKDIILEIIGDGPEKDNIIELIKEKNLSSYVRISPTLKRDKLLEKTASASVVAVVSLTEVNSNFASEALSLGKTVIMTKNSEFYFNNRKSALIYYIDPYSPEDIRDRIEEAFSKLNDCSGLKDAGETSTEEEISKKHLKIIIRLFEENKEVNAAHSQAIS
jgi:putative flippase GtrA/glycosyltransferase involved in cell wall biosynthesis